MLFRGVICLAFCLSLVVSDTKVYDVTQFGVDSTGTNVSTKEIQKTIDEASKNKGGIVYFPKGEYRTGPIELKSGVTLKIGDRALVIFVDYEHLYPAFEAVLPSGRNISFQHTPFIRALGQRDISIVGNGIIYGVGHIWRKWVFPTEIRPIFIYIDECRDFLVDGVQISDSPQFHIQIKDTEQIVIKNSILRSAAQDFIEVGPRTNGINCESCRYLHVKNVTILSGDDGIALQSDRLSNQLKPTEHVLIEDSRILSGLSGIAIGSRTEGRVRNVTVRNCYVKGTDRGLYIKSSRGQGGLVEDIHFHNITLENIGKEAIVIALLFNNTDAGLHEKNIHPQAFTDTTPWVRDVEFQHIRGNSKLESVFIVGLPEAPVENTTFTDLTVKSDHRIFLNQTRLVIINGEEQ